MLRVRGYQSGLAAISSALPLRASYSFLLGPFRKPNHHIIVPVLSQHPFVSPRVCSCCAMLWRSFLALKAHETKREAVLHMLHFSFELPQTRVQHLQKVQRVSETSIKYNLCVFNVVANFTAENAEARRSTQKAMGVNPTLSARFIIIKNAGM